MSAVEIWGIVAIVLFIAELITPGFVIACFGIGALGAVLPALFGLSIIWQVVAFSIFSLLALLLLRPFVQKISRNKKEVLTGADALIGREGVVTTTIEGRQGRVAIDGDAWKAISQTPNTIIPQGTTVVVVARESIILTVRPK